jgi:type 1 glutamine amidotransferase
MQTRRPILWVLATMLAGIWSAAPEGPGATAVEARQQAPAGPRQPGGPGGPRGPQRLRTRKVVLAWADTRNGIAQHDSTSHALAVIERLGYESGAYDTFIRTDSNIAAMDPKRTTGEPASGGPSLRMADAIFFLGHRDVPVDEQQKADILKFVRDDGKGFVAAHTALTAWESWPEYGELIGGRYDGHPWNTTAATVVNEAPDFPATRHFPATFVLTDEFYQAKFFSRDKARVLLRVDATKLPPNAEVHVKDGDMPIVWAKAYGKGRVMYSTFAHDAKTWDDRDVQQMYLEAIKWALGMTEGDITPRPMPASR